jgi:hypothetical protein
MLSYWPVMLIVVIVAAALIYLYRSEVEAFVLGPRVEIDHNEALKNVAEDWKQTGYIDFSVPQELCANPDRLAEPRFYCLAVEEYRVVNTIGGGTSVEQRWRRGSLADAQRVAENYQQFLQEHPEEAFNEGSRKLMRSTGLSDRPAA